MTNNIDHSRITGRSRFSHDIPKTPRSCIRLGRILAALLALATLVFMSIGLYSGASVNWDVPYAMITLHQMWDAIWALIPWFGLAFISFILAMLTVDGGPVLISVRRNPKT